MSPLTGKRVAVITETDSDLLFCMKTLDPRLIVAKPSEALAIDWNAVDSIAILGGADAEPLLLPPPLRNRIERECAAGKRVFAEYTGSIGHVYFESPASTRYARLAVVSPDWLPDEPVGALIDDQCGERLRPHAFTCAPVKPLLSYAVAHAHDRMAPADLHEDAASQERALWFEAEGRLLVCAFRLANFVRARHAPHERVRKLIGFILNWLYGAETDLKPFPRSYRVASETRGNEPVTEADIRRTADRALLWIRRSGILLRDGADGAREGLGTEIDYTGRQRVSRYLRVDCIGELAFPFWLHGVLAGDEESRRISENLAAYVFDHYVNREPGPLYGMMRWTDQAWGVCYQDDAARAILPQLFRCFYEGTDNRLRECEDVLQFLIRTTGTDGTRPFRTDNNKLTAEELERLRSTPGNLPSAHYNAYYYAALCIAYRLTGRDEYRRTALAGLSTIMNAYPNTKREQSQTQELCRLILPLSWLYAVTGDELHLQWLYRVARDLQAFAHPCGAYLEWDDGYAAAMRHKAGAGESSLLCRNGDPVADLLYSNNWLAIGWMQAYFITGDSWFKERWTDTARFMAGAQIVSDNPVIDGAWARAFDVERNEVFGSPADAGWGPWAIESGWTVAEITSGLLMGLLESKLKPLHRAERFSSSSS
ncbi:hypothetical protein ACFQWB_11310 [Paenibacillus thermoaerophilus]|uniref:Uncharacterized protein n=1 Tax=Paenibacillus thermoaerophilus TaxID=1215385 RepID=A0ABW2V2X9_9BACL|nr:hypothetical protein [Paenibacillus thermoaerophilus]TMV18658.1 hypothetical protein FE781_01585 [Paenibacillus thermoaerophilus]